MNDTPPTAQQKALAFAKQHRHWLLPTFFAICFFIAPGTSPATSGWKAFGVITTFLLGVAAVGHFPHLYSRLSSGKKLMTYGASAAGLLFLAIFWIAGPGPASSDTTPPDPCQALVKELVDGSVNNPKIFEIDNVSQWNVPEGKQVLTCNGNAITEKGKAQIIFGVSKTPQNQSLLEWRFTETFNPN